MGDKKFMDRVKANQEARLTAEPQPLTEIRVIQMSNGELRVHRPEGHEAQVIELLSTAIIIISRKITQEEQSRIVAPPAGMKVQ